MIITVAIPCYKSEKTIERVVEGAKAAILKRPGNDYRFILVNDYPSDNTFEVIRKMCAEDEKIIGVNLSKNYGQTSAKLAAIPYFDGDVLVYMDDDGQHPSDGIYLLVDKILEGNDVVYAYFKQKKHSVFKKITSNLNSFISELNGTKPKGVHISSFLAYSKSTVEALKKYDSPFPSIGGYLNSVVNKVANVEMPHQSRLEGSSNYTLGKLIKLWLNGFTNFSLLPIRVVLFTGIIFAILGFIFGLSIVIRYLIGFRMLQGYTSTISAVMFFSGLILFSLGFIGEYVGRIYMTISKLPQYHVRETVNAEKPKDGPGR